jgi:hypothetical protein
VDKLFKGQKVVLQIFKGMPCFPWPSPSLRLPFQISITCLHIPYSVIWVPGWTTASLLVWLDVRYLTSTDNSKFMIISSIVILYYNYSICTLLLVSKKKPYIFHWKIPPSLRRVVNIRRCHLGGKHKAGDKKKGLKCKWKRRKRKDEAKKNLIKRITYLPTKGTKKGNKCAWGIII